MRNAAIILLFALLGYFTLISSDFKVIAAGIAIFLVGMVFLEDGFKRFAVMYQSWFIVVTSLTRNQDIVFVITEVSGASKKLADCFT